MILKSIAVQVVAVDSSGKTHHIGAHVQDVPHNATLVKLRFVADKAARFAAQQIRSAVDDSPVAAARHD